MRRFGLAVGAAAAVIVIGAFACGRVMSSFAFHDLVYDSVPSKVGCGDAPPARTVERVGSKFPAIADAEAVAVERCQGAVLEIQYGSHAVRAEVEEFLADHGRWDRATGWWWRSVPVQLRNV